jgi:thiol-disulfide isomerase/thioredoxin
MRRPSSRGLLLAAAAALSIALGTLAARAAGGDSDWSLPGLSGGTLSSKDVAAGDTIVVVFASWAPKCRDVVERTNPVAARWSGRARVALVDFQEEASDVSSFLAGKSPGAPVYLDGDGTFAKQHQVTTLPSLVVFHDGTFHNLGQLPDDPDAALSRELPARPHS